MPLSWHIESTTNYPLEGTARNAFSGGYLNEPSPRAIIAVAVITITAKRGQRNLNVLPTSATQKQKVSRSVANVGFLVTHNRIIFSIIIQNINIFLGSNFPLISSFALST